MLAKTDSQRKARFQIDFRIASRIDFRIASRCPSRFAALVASRLERHQNALNAEASVRIVTIHAACAAIGRCVSTAMLITVIACMPKTHSGGGVAPLSAAPPTIEVTNDRYDFVVVYLIHSGARFELGVVPAMSRHTFTPNAAQLGTGVDVTLGAGPRGVAMNYVTLPLALLPGHNATWTVRERWTEEPVVR